MKSNPRLPGFVTLKRGQREGPAVQLELDPAHRVVHMGQSLDGSADGRRARLVERDVAAGHDPARMRREGRGAPKLLA